MYSRMHVCTITRRMCTQALAHACKHAYACAPVADVRLSLRLLTLKMVTEILSIITNSENLHRTVEKCAVEWDGRDQEGVFTDGRADPFRHLGFSADQRSVRSMNTNYIVDVSYICLNIATELRTHTQTHTCKHTHIRTHR